MDVSDKLKRISGKVVTSKVELLGLSSDKSPYRLGMPKAAVFPSSAKEISKILKFCNDNNIGVTVRGGGTSLTGSSAPAKDSVVIDVSNMRKVLEINIEDRYAVVESGIMVDDLNRRLSRYGYFYPPDPGSSSIASIGGTIATNAGGLHAVTYGTTKEWVLGLEVALPNGKIINTGSKVLKRSIGYDLTALMVASEGTLGVVTKATLKIIPKQEETSMAVAYYSDIRKAGNAIGELKKCGITPLAAEFMDRKAMDVMEASKGIKFPKRANYLLLVQFASTEESLKRILEKGERMLAKYGAIKVETAGTPKAMERLYLARKGLHTSMDDNAKARGMSILIADVVVPSSEVPSALEEMQRVSKRYKQETVLFGHIGDGNIHANIVYDPKSRSDLASIAALHESFAQIAIKHEGSVSGEHGIGLEKKRLLKEEFEARHTIYNIELMRAIKKVFDPKGILNKGKIFD